MADQFNMIWLKAVMTQLLYYLYTMLADIWFPFTCIFRCFSWQLRHCGRIRVLVSMKLLLVHSAWLENFLWVNSGDAILAVYLLMENIITVYHENKEIVIPKVVTVVILKFEEYGFTVMTLNFRTDMSGQTEQTQIRLLLEEQSDQGLHCLPFRLHCLDSLLFRRVT